MSDEFKKIIDGLNNEINSLKNTKHQLQGQLRQMTAERNSFDNSYAELYQLHHKVKTQVFLNQEALQDLSNQIKELNIKLSSTNKSLDEANKKIQEYEKAEALRKEQQLHVVENDDEQLEQTA